jgi:hypothetical protein
MTTAPRPALHVGQDHVQQQGALADAGLADQVHMLAGVGHVEANRVAADLRPAEHLHRPPAGGYGDRCGHGLGAGTIETGYGQVLRQGGQRGQLRHGGQEPAVHPPAGQHGHGLVHAHPA